MYRANNIRHNDLNATNQKANRTGTRLQQLSNGLQQQINAAMLVGHLSGENHVILPITIITTTVIMI